MSSTFEKIYKAKTNNKLKKPPPKKEVKKEEAAREITPEDQVDVYEYIKNIKKELAKTLKDGKEGLVSDLHSQLLSEMHDSLKPAKVDNKQSVLDNPFLKKQKPKTKIEVASAKHDNHDDISEKKKTQMSQYSYNNSFKYMDLSRVDNRESIFKMMNKSVSKSQAKNESFYEIEKDRKMRKDLHLETLRNQKREEENKLLKDRPTLTEVSKKIIKTKYSEERPLYLRTSEIIEQKNQTLINMQKMFLEKEAVEISKNTISQTKNNSLLITKNTNFLNTTQPIHYNISSIQETTYNHKRFEDWRNFALEWNKKKHEKNRKLKEDKDNEIFIDEISRPYRPLINSNSEYLASVINNDMPLVQRLYNRQLFDKKQSKLHKIYREMTPNFKPNLRKNVPGYLKNVESRLMTVNSTPDLSLHVEKKREPKPKFIHKSRSMGNSLNNSQSSLISKKIHKQNSAQSLKSIKIKEVKSWVSQLESINDDAPPEDIKSPFAYSLFKMAGQQDNTNSVFLDQKYKNLLNNLLPQQRSEKKKSYTGVNSERGSRVNLNLSTDDNKIFFENFEESKVLSSSEVRGIEGSFKK